MINQYKKREFIGKAAGTNLKHRVFFLNDEGELRRKDVPPAYFDKLDIEDQTSELTFSYIVEKEYKKLVPSKKTEFAKWQRANKGYSKEDAFRAISLIKKNKMIGNSIGTCTK